MLDLMMLTEEELKAEYSRLRSKDVIGDSTLTRMSIVKDLLLGEGVEITFDENNKEIFAKIYWDSNERGS